MHCINWAQGLLKEHGAGLLTKNLGCYAVASPPVVDVGVGRPFQKKFSIYCKSFDKRKKLGMVRWLGGNGCRYANINILSLKQANYNNAAIFFL